ncbi:hypothetical protein GLOTRDRAFT_110702 [Gloeophyllum trabeum ATCC 11539]|uniref:Integral membrane protein S linking to the trans Golgi network-domain-containing protein n=1 Tax=Gloeophyllum trabeum (strain ATCC 11539 / FP-39264 / Madison 617) TaxID=670483 RepID=S7QA16_GLOTA|nr:uncharacterized protein GLOTRDRAFT_110702 [Gloeophyllum trabeum ATCC 11539]EPQ56198.1 hypothetical protein GLOTRDRAFT_110702 [Gloeophyllum trabeum ATCC 11539]
MQTLHYLTLSLITPPLLAVFADPDSLEFEGGAANVGMIMDWRQMTGRPTAQADTWGLGSWSGGRKLDESAGSSLPMLEGGWKADPVRGWVIAFGWIIASGIDVYWLSTVVRRPRLILDFALTLVFNHLVLTTYYAASLPTSLFFWIVMVACSTILVVAGEQVCVRREMREGMSVIGVGQADETGRLTEEMELGDVRGRSSD